MVVIVLGIIFAVMGNRPTTIEPAAEVIPRPQAVAPTPPKQLITRENQTEYDIIYNSRGFSPNPVTIKKGDIVKFNNQTGGDMWIASGPHPAHTNYPGTDNKKCGTAEAKNMFDACRGYKMGDSWAFTFDEVGTWGYHNHARPSDFGRIIVTE